MTTDLNETWGGRLAQEAQFTAGSAAQAPVVLGVTQCGTVVSRTSNFTQLGVENPLGKNWLSLFEGYRQKLLPAPTGFTQYLFTGGAKTFRALVANEIQEHGRRCSFIIIEHQPASDADALEELSRMLCLGRMTAEFAHELNNALANLSGWVQLCIEDMPAGDSKRGSLEVIDKTIRHISHTAASLMATARGDMTAGFRPLDVAEIVGSAMEMVEPQCNSRGITLCRQLEPLPEINGSATQLKQVLLNLLINAANAISGSGTITVTGSRCTDSQIRVQVTDTGCGIPADTLDKIFEPFYTTRREAGSAGLGLYICREIIRRHQGELAVESVVGEGTTFSITLPVEPAV